MFNINSQSIKWPDNLKEAASIQKQLANKVRLENNFANLNLIAGIDVSYDLTNNLSYAVIVTMTLDQLKPIQTIIKHLPTTIPYVPGFLSFREIPVILEALKDLPHRPDIFMVDGQGVAHPRGLGIAAHLGVLTNIPSIGVAKSKLIGSYQEPDWIKGSQSPLINKNKKIGTVLRSKDNVKPLFISSGHYIDHETAINVTIACLTKYRLPEPTRYADKISKNCKIITA
ncbi:MAG: deoxyribonuclease V [Alphaproteobacteria bacterium]|nr:deoxyribonuclease V [Alphaproteobacteria bacterium]